MEVDKSNVEVKAATPLNFDCPNCQSKAGSKCTQPTNDTRRVVHWFHLARQAKADHANQQEKETNRS